MTIISQLKQDLLALRALFNKPDKWTKAANAKNARGILTSIYSAEATCWCLNGATLRVCGKRSTDASILRDKLENYTIRSLTRWNDAPERTFGDVIELIDKAIAEEPPPPRVLLTNRHSASAQPYQ